MDRVSPELLLHQALRLHIEKWGERATLAQVYRHLGRPMPGPASAVDPIIGRRHAHMVELYKTDPEILRRRRQGDRHLYSILATLAIKENARPAELDATGEPTAYAVNQVVRSFPYFSFDDPKRGFDEGLWFA
jgi:hypothetical protein